MRPEMELLREQAKKRHDERVAQTPQRIDYAIKRFEEENIKYVLKNKQIGHFHLLDKDNNLFQFWASTGKIYFDKKTKDARGFKSYYEERRGIENCIKIIKYFKSKDI